MQVPRNPTRAVRIGSTTIGDGHPIAVQSMTATHTQDVDATVAQVQDLERAGADVVRIAVDSQKDAAALAEELQIPEVIEETLNLAGSGPVTAFESLYEADRLARELAGEAVDALM